MTELRASINDDVRKIAAWVAGFFEEKTPQSSTRVTMYALTAAAIKYAYRENPDIEVLGALLAAALACGGIKLAKDIKTASINAGVAKTVVTGENAG